MMSGVNCFTNITSNTASTTNNHNNTHIQPDNPLRSNTCQVPTFTSNPPTANVLTDKTNQINISSSRPQILTTLTARSSLHSHRLRPNQLTSFMRQRVLHKNNIDSSNPRLSNKPTLLHENRSLEKLSSAISQHRAINNSQQHRRQSVHSILLSNQNIKSKISELRQNTSSDLHCNTIDSPLECNETNKEHCVGEQESASIDNIDHPKENIVVLDDIKDPNYETSTPTFVECNKQQQQDISNLMAESESQSMQLEFNLKSISPSMLTQPNHQQRQLLESGSIKQPDAIKDDKSDLRPQPILRSETQPLPKIIKPKSNTKHSPVRSRSNCLRLNSNLSATSNYTANADAHHQLFPAIVSTDCPDNTLTRTSPSRSVVALASSTNSTVGLTSQPMSPQSDITEVITDDKTEANVANIDNHNVLNSSPLNVSRECNETIRDFRQPQRQRSLTNMNGVLKLTGPQSEREYIEMRSRNDSNRGKEINIRQYKLEFAIRSRTSPVTADQLLPLKLSDQWVIQFNSENVPDNSSSIEHALMSWRSLKLEQQRRQRKANLKPLYFLMPPVGSVIMYESQEVVPFIILPTVPSLPWALYETRIFISDDTLLPTRWRKRNWCGLYLPNELEQMASDAASIISDIAMICSQSSVDEETRARWLDWDPSGYLNFPYVANFISCWSKFHSRSVVVMSAAYHEFCSGMCSIDDVFDVNSNQWLQSSEHKPSSWSFTREEFHKFATDKLFILRIFSTTDYNDASTRRHYTDDTMSLFFALSLDLKPIQLPQSIPMNELDFPSGSQLHSRLCPNWPHESILFNGWEVNQNPSHLILVLPHLVYNSFSAVHIKSPSRKRSRRCQQEQYQLFVAGTQIDQSHLGVTDGATTLYYLFSFLRFNICESNESNRLQLFVAVHNVAEKKLIVGPWERFFSSSSTSVCIRSVNGREAPIDQTRRWIGLAINHIRENRSYSHLWPRSQQPKHCVTEINTNFITTNVADNYCRSPSQSTRSRSKVQANNTNSNNQIDRDGVGVTDNISTPTANCSIVRDHEFPDFKLIALPTIVNKAALSPRLTTAKKTPPKKPPNTPRYNNQNRHKKSIEKYHQPQSSGSDSDYIDYTPVPLSNQKNRNRKSDQRQSIEFGEISSVNPHQSAETCRFSGSNKNQHKQNRKHQQNRSRSISSLSTPQTKRKKRISAASMDRKSKSSQLNPQRRNVNSSLIHSIVPAATTTATCDVCGRTFNDQLNPQRSRAAHQLHCRKELARMASDVHDELFLLPMDYGNTEEVRNVLIKYHGQGTVQQLDLSHLQIIRPYFNSWCQWRRSDNAPVARMTRSHKLHWDQSSPVSTPTELNCTKRQRSTTITKSHSPKQNTNQNESNKSNSNVSQPNCVIEAHTVDGFEYSKSLKHMLENGDLVEPARLAKYRASCDKPIMSSWILADVFHSFVKSKLPTLLASSETVHKIPMTFSQAVETLKKLWNERITDEERNSIIHCSVQRFLAANTTEQVNHPSTDICQPESSSQSSQSVTIQQQQQQHSVLPLTNVHPLQQPMMVAQPHPQQAPQQYHCNDQIPLIPLAAPRYQQHFQQPAPVYYEYGATDAYRQQPSTTEMIQVQPNVAGMQDQASSMVPQQGFWQYHPQNYQHQQERRPISQHVHQYPPPNYHPHQPGQSSFHQQSCVPIQSQQISPPSSTITNQYACFREQYVGQPYNQQQNQQCQQIFHPQSSQQQPQPQPAMNCSYLPQGSAPPDPSAYIVNGSYIGPQQIPPQSIQQQLPQSSQSRPVGPVVLAESSSPMFNGVQQAVQAVQAVPAPSAPIQIQPQSSTSAQHSNYSNRYIAYPNRSVQMY